VLVRDNQGRRRTVIGCARGLCLGGNLLFQPVGDRASRHRHGLQRPRFKPKQAVWLEHAEAVAAMEKADIEKWWPIITAPGSTAEIKIGAGKS
jgi:hypothetical protein